MSCTFISHVPECLSAEARARGRALEMIGGRTESYAKAGCPVKTGNLRNSITHEQYDDHTEVIGSNVFYRCDILADIYFDGTAAEWDAIVIDSNNSELFSSLIHYTDGDSESMAPAWSVIGSICGTNWDVDFPLNPVGVDVFVSDELELYAGDELKVRLNGSWNVNFGADGTRDGPNLVVSETGLYQVIFFYYDEYNADIILDLIALP